MQIRTIGDDAKRRWNRIKMVGDQRVYPAGLSAYGLADFLPDPILMEKFQFKDFLRLFAQIVPRADLEDIFRVIAAPSGGKHMTAEQVRDFLNKTQRDPRLNEILHPYATTETARTVIDKYEPHESFRAEGHLSQVCEGC